MRRIAAITIIALRSAIRSRIVLLLMIPLFLAVVAIPILVKGDQTVSGSVQIMVQWSLWLALAILSIATLWSGCAAISSEVEEKQIHLIITKPVTRLQLWLGKWLALLILNAVLLVFTGICVYTIVQYRSNKAVAAEKDPAKRAEIRRMLDEELLVSRTRAKPDFDIKALARQAREQITDGNRKQFEAGEIDVMPPSPPLGEIAEILGRRAGKVNHEQIKHWDFTLPHRPDPERPVFLYYKYHSGDIYKRLCEGLWIFGNESNKVEITVIPTEHKTRRPISIEIPHSAIAEDNTVRIAYHNIDTAGVGKDGASSVFFDITDHLEVRYRSGSFLGNFVRVLLMMFFQLAFLAAVGVTMGSFFSLPVATFSAVGLLFVQTLSGFLETSLTEDNSGSALMQPVYDFLLVLIRPLRGPQIFELLANGLEVTMGYLLSTFLWKVLLYGGIFALLGSLVLKRRELGLPS